MPKCTVFGIEFDSELEAGRYMELRSMQESGLISDLVPRPATYTLLDTAKDQWGKTWPRIRYTPDFEYVEADGTLIIEECKPATRKARSWGREVPVKLRLLADKMAGQGRVRVWTPETEYVV